VFEFSAKTVKWVCGSLPSQGQPGPRLHSKTKEKPWASSAIIAIGVVVPIRDGRKSGSNFKQLKNGDRLPEQSVKFRRNKVVWIVKTDFAGDFLNHHVVPLVVCIVFGSDVATWATLEKEMDKPFVGING